MNWQQFLALGLVLAVAAIFVWRSSDPKKHRHGCGCGCAHEDDESAKEKNIPR
jgi:hypothetical protein